MKGRDRHHPKRPTAGGSKQPKAGGAPVDLAADRTSALLRTGVDAHRRGDLTAAEEAYGAVLAAAPRHADALHLLGVLTLQKGDPIEAERLVRQAIAAAARVADYHDSLGSALMARDEAEAAMLAHAAAIRLRPEFAQARFNLGNAMSARGDHRRAVAAFTGAVALAPEYAKAWHNLGNALRALEWYEAAASAFGHCVRLTPDVVGEYINHGDVLCALGRLAEGLEQQRIAVTLAPTDATQRYNLGVVLQQMGRLEEAELAYREALRLRPYHAGALNNLGSVLRRLNRPADAARCHRLALVFLPDFPEAFFNLGNAMQKVGRLKEAAAIYRMVLGRSPEFAAATHNMGLLSLMSGDLDHGWRGYEKRFAVREAKPNRHPPVPRWNGEPLAGRRLLVWREQGIGDEMMLASCLGDLRGMDGPVLLEAEPRLTSLFRRSFPWIEVRPESCDAAGDETLADIGADLHVPMGSLPRLLRRRVSAFPPTRSWLTPDPALVARWRTRVGALGRGLKVGICWRSRLTGDGREAAYTALREWAPLLRMGGVRVVSLQYDDCRDEVEALRAGKGLAPHVWSDLDLKDDFEATAALIANLDLVITVATSVGEMAGALGVPVWRLGGAVGDWSALGTPCRPWFPTMRLWRPSAGETIGGVIPVVVRELSALVASSSSRSTGGGPDPLAGPDAERVLDRALSAHRTGCFEAALSAYRDVLAISPAHADALHLIGVVEQSRGDRGRALGWIARALRTAPLFPLALNNLGVVLQGMRRTDAAEAALSRALAISPAMPEAVAHMGVNHENATRYADAVQWHRRAIALAPATAAHHNNLGTTLEFLGRFKDAENAYRVGASLDPSGIPHVLSNLGNAARLHGRPSDARRWFARAGAASPGFPLASWNLALIALARGDVVEGWAGYEKRFLAPQLHPAPEIDLPIWRGEELRGRRLLVWPEQGIGDEILFAATLEPLKRLDGTVVLESDPRLVPLFRRSFPWAECRISAVRLAGPRAGDPMDCDLQIAMGSLPAILRVRPGDFAASPLPHLVPDPDLRAEWRERVDALGPGFKVGVAWRSSMKSVYRDPAYLNLVDLLPIMGGRGVRAINLQYGDCADEIAACRETSGSFPHEWDDLDLTNDFDAVAALMVNLDLVVTPATSAGELAGSLGVPTWRMCGRDWTQLGVAEARPWYPSMRLLHPRPGEDMRELPRRIASRLRRMEIDC